MKQYLNIIIITIFIALFFSACEKCEHLILDEEAYVLSASISGNSGIIEGEIIEKDIFFTLLDESDYQDVQLNLEISEKAEIVEDINSIQDWTVPVEVNIKSVSEAVVNTYTIYVQVNKNVVEYEGVLNISTQEELNTLAKYGYTKVGGLYLNGKDITDVSPLNSIEEITTNLIVSEIGAVDFIMENLKRVGNFKFESLNCESISLPSLEIVAENFIVGYRSPLPNTLFPPEHLAFNEINLPMLKCVGSDFYLYLLSKIQTLESLSNLSSVGGDVVILGGAYKDLRGLSNLKQVNNLNIWSAELNSLDGFAVETVAGKLELYVNKITSLESFSSLKKVYSLDLYQGENIVDFKGLEGVDIEQIKVRGFPMVTSLKGLPIKSDMLGVTIEEMLTLTDISALEPLVNCEGMFFLGGLPALENIDAIKNLRRAGSLTIDWLKASDISAIKDIEMIFGRLLIARMDNLEKLPKFTSLTDVGYLTITQLHKITNLDGLQSLEMVVAGGIDVVDCREIVDLTGLENIVSVESESPDKINIASNPKLKNYTAVGDLFQKYVNVYKKLYVMHNGYNPTASDVLNEKWIGEGGSGIGGGR